jgi:hypothetical protein
MNTEGLDGSYVCPAATGNENEVVVAPVPSLTYIVVDAALWNRTPCRAGLADRRTVSEVDEVAELTSAFEAW